MKTKYIAITAIIVSFCSPFVNAQDKDGAIIDSFIKNQIKDEEGSEHKDARKVILGDINHDGIPDLSVLYTIEGAGGSNIGMQYLAVFERLKGTLKPMKYIELGGNIGIGTQVDSIAVKNNYIELQTLTYGPDDARCCPSIEGKTSYVLANGQLKEQPGGP